MKVLIIDDDPAFEHVLQRYLERHGHLVAAAEDGPRALALVSHFQPDVVVLDILLPQVDGIEVLRGLRAFSDVPVLVLSTVGQEQVIVDALDQGADDYLHKPPVLEELRVRLQALMRRAHKTARARMVYEDQRLRIDMENHVFCRQGEPVPLAPREWSVLGCLVRNAGRTVPFEQLAREALGENVDLERAKVHLAVLIHSLRLKIEEESGVPAYIVTRVGVGYEFVDRRAAGC